MDTMTRWEGACPRCGGDLLELDDRAPLLLCVDCRWPAAQGGPCGAVRRLAARLLRRLRPPLGRVVAPGWPAAMGG